MTDIGIGRLAELTGVKFQPFGSMNRMVSLRRPAEPKAVSAVMTRAPFDGCTSSATHANLALT